MTVTFFFSTVSTICTNAMSNFSENYEDYFQAVELKGNWTCVSQCSAAHENAIICENDGSCEVSEKGPSC